MIKHELTVRYDKDFCLHDILDFHEGEKVQWMFDHSNENIMIINTGEQVKLQCTGFSVVSDPWQGKSRAFVKQCDFDFYTKIHSGGPFGALSGLPPTQNPMNAHVN